MIPPLFSWRKYDTIDVIVSHMCKNIAVNICLSATISTTKSNQWHLLFANKTICPHETCKLPMKRQRETREKKQRKLLLFCFWANAKVAVRTLDWHGRKGLHDERFTCNSRKKQLDKSVFFLFISKESVCVQLRLSGKIKLTGGCVKCPLRALIEGQLSALASLEKTEKCPPWQNV